MNQNMMSIENFIFSSVAKKFFGVGIATGGFLVIFFCPYWRNEHDANLKSWLALLVVFCLSSLSLLSTLQNLCVL